MIFIALIPSYETYHKEYSSSDLILILQIFSEELSSTNHRKFDIVSINLNFKLTILIILILLLTDILYFGLILPSNYAIIT
jgi:hypothetical protein